MKLMTATTPPPTSRATKPVDPDDFRMTIGEHLEELRARLILGLLGFGVTAIVCLLFGKQLITIFCQPLVDAMASVHLNPQVVVTEAQEGFMVWIEISLICAAAIASPWIVYQLWKFVASGLYPAERKTITKYLPLSITLLISGMLFLYFFVLPISVKFFFVFNNEIPLSLPKVYVDPKSIPTSQPTVIVPQVAGNPEHPVPFQLWFDRTENRLKMFYPNNDHDHEIQVIPFGPATLITPMITLSKYIDMVVGMLLAFGISFQMPLVVLALVKIGIVEIPTLRKLRRYIYFAIGVISGCIIPDAATGMIALMIPLILLYEMGIFLAWYSQRQAAKAEQ